MKRLGAAFWIAAWSLVPVAFAHDPRIADSRVGLATEEVVRAKLRTYGITQIAEIRRVDTKYEIIATIDGRQRHLTVDGLRSIVADEHGVPLPASMVPAQFLMRPPNQQGAVPK